MRIASIALSVAFFLATSPVEASENRCGILVNPTPANWWLNDRDGEWIMGVQGGYQADGMENMPESLFEKGWVRTNGYYGHRCACLTVDTDRKLMRIRKVYGAKALAMKRCDSDKALQHTLGRKR